MTESSFCRILVHMNKAQVIGMRMTHEETTSVVKRTMTAQEMALTSHSLSRSGDMATLTEDGAVFVWDKRFDHWAMWKKGASR